MEETSSCRLDETTTTRLSQIENPAIEEETPPQPIEAQTLAQFQAVRDQLTDSSLDTTQSMGVATKNQKKKANKRKNKVKNLCIKEWQTRHMSPAYSKIMDLQCQVEIELINYNPLSVKVKEFLSNGSDSKHSSSGDENSDEEFEDYKKDGYHPVHQNEIVDHRYLCLKKLGWGHFSTVWLALKLQDKQLYALKIQKAADKYTESALEEEEILYDVAQNYKNLKWEKSVRNYMKNPEYEVTREDTHNVQMYDQFFHHGQNGKHSVMAFEVLGKNLLALIKKYNYKGIPIKMVREITRQCLMSLDYLHRVCKIIHTDLKPENVVFGLPERDKFDLLYTHVLNTKNVDLFETNEPIVLSKKQAKNQKKKDKKKKKVQQANEIEQPDQDDDEVVILAEGPIKKTKAQIIIAEMRQKLDLEEQATREKKVFKLKQRSKSAPTLTSDLTKEVLMSEREQNESGIWIFDHPLRSYKAYIKKYVSNDFELFKIKHASNEIAFKEAIKRVRPKVAMRVRSQNPMYKTISQRNELKPKSIREVRKEEEMDMNIKLCDMGNACYIEKHYSDVIQTREYRSPEVILQGEYDETADIWSLACMVFELVTGDYLFDPKKGKTFKKNDDHLALISELIGELHGDELKYMQENCEAWDDFFEPANRNATKFKLRRIKSLKSWPIFKVLLQKYKVMEGEARLLSRFLMRMLKWSPKKRASARDLLDDPWLKVGPLDKNTHMSRTYCNEWRRATGQEFSSSESGDVVSGEESEEEESDSRGSQSANSCESLEDDLDDDEDDENVVDDGDSYEVGTQNQTLLNTVPNVTGLNYKLNSTLQKDECESEFS